MFIELKLRLSASMLAPRMLISVPGEAVDEPGSGKMLTVVEPTGSFGSDDGVTVDETKVLGVGVGLLPFGSVCVEVPCTEGVPAELSFDA